MRHRSPHSISSFSSRKHKLFRKICSLRRQTRGSYRLRDVRLLLRKSHQDQAGKAQFSLWDIQLRLLSHRQSIACTQSSRCTDTLDFEATKNSDIIASHAQKTDPIRFPHSILAASKALVYASIDQGSPPFNSPMQIISRSGLRPAVRDTERRL